MVALISACGSSNESSGDSGNGKGIIDYGLIAPFSGETGAFGPPEKAAVEAAISAINEGGGVKVGDESYEFRLKTYDSAYDPPKAVTAARQAVDQDGIKFLEVTGGAIVPAVQPITEPAGALVFAVAAGSEYLGEEHPLTFRPYFDLPDSVEADLRYLKTKLPENPSVVHLYPNDDLGHSVADGANQRSEEVGFETEAIFAGRGATDFAPVLTKIVDEVDVIDFGPMPPSQYSLAMKQARQLGYEGTFMMPDSFSETLYEAVSPEQVVGSVTSPTWQSLETPRGKEFEASQMQRLGRVEYWTAQPFDNLFLLQAAIEQAGTLDTEKVAEELSQVEVEGALGQVSYGGEALYGLPRVFEISYPVGEITANGDLKIVSE